MAITPEFMGESQQTSETLSADAFNGRIARIGSFSIGINNIIKQRQNDLNSYTDPLDLAAGAIGADNELEASPLQAFHQELPASFQPFIEKRKLELQTVLAKDSLDTHMYVLANDVNRILGFPDGDTNLEKQAGERVFVNVGSFEKPETLRLAELHGVKLDSFMGEGDSILTLEIGEIGSDFATDHHAISFNEAGTPNVVFVTPDQAGIDIS